MRTAKIVLSALVATAVLFAAFYFYTNRREFAGTAREYDQQRAESKRERDEKHAEFVQFVSHVRVAEKIADGNERCLAYPDLPGSQWDKALVKELCRVANLPIISFEKIEQLLQEKDAAQIDRVFDNYAKQDVSDPQWRGVLLRAFENLFETNNVRVASFVEHWVAEAPKSANAHIARAAFLINQAYTLRGTATVGNTSEESFHAMRKRLDAAVVDLDAATAIDPQRKVAWALRIEAAMSSGDQDSIAHAAANSLAIDPLDDTVYAVWLAAVDPRWGGPRDGMERVVDAAQPYLDRNPLLKVLDASKRWRESMDCCADHLDESNIQTPDYMTMMKLAPQRRALQNAAASGDEESIFYASELIRFWPDTDAYLQRARIVKRISARLQDAATWADADLAQAEKLANRPTASLGELAKVQAERGHFSDAGDTYRWILRSNPRDVAALRALIKIDVGEPRTLKEAQTMAERLATLQPDVRETWLLVASAYPSEDQKFCAALKRFAELGGFAPGVRGAASRCHDVDKWPNSQ